MIEKGDLKLIQSSLNYLEHVAQEYELDKPEYSAALREFQRKQRRELESLSEQMLQLLGELDNYTEYMEVSRD